MASHATSLPRLAHLPLAPAEVAMSLRHLPGFVFLDSSAASDGKRAISVIGALPRESFRGDIRKDAEQLREAIHRGNRQPVPDFGFPTGGLFGWIDFNGQFTFGDYTNLLVFDHLSEQWWEFGDIALVEHIRAKEFDPSPSLDFQPATPREEFLHAVRLALEYIAAGDIYQVNLAHRFDAAWPTESDPFSTYLRLRETSPAPYSAFLDFGPRQILSSSPECFLRLSDRCISTRPIKGTRPRFRDLERDEKSAYDLITSPKEVAELVMITDLERNDLGQVCEFGSVEAVELLKLERYAQVFHLVSHVRGILREDVDHVGALAACFPGGSISGAPKKRALEIIDELEDNPRGIYTGALGYFGYNGESQFNIAIRTAIVDGDRAHFHVGAGIVADSVAEKEYEETLHKAAGILQAAGL
ncbi:MAG: anthranilate synthase component I family protein [Verrucomicrobiota bacterium]